MLYIRVDIVPKCCGDFGFYVRAVKQTISNGFSVAFARGGGNYLPAVPNVGVVEFGGVFGFVIIGVLDVPVFVGGLGVPVFVGVWIIWKLAFVFRLRWSG